MCGQGIRTYTGTNKKSEVEAMKKQIQQLIQDKKGANLVEYILLVGLIAIIVIAAARTFGQAVSTKMGEQEGEVNGI